MKGSSVKALLVLSLILLVPGTTIMSPDGRLFCLVLAGICAAPAVIAGRVKSMRIIGALVLLAALGLALTTYVEHSASYDKYRKSFLPRPSAGAR